MDEIPLLVVGHKITKIIVLGNTFHGFYITVQENCTLEEAEFLYFCRSEVFLMRLLNLSRVFAKKIGGTFYETDIAIHIDMISL